MCSDVFRCGSDVARIGLRGGGGKCMGLEIGGRRAGWLGRRGVGSLGGVPPVGVYIFSSVHTDHRAPEPAEDGGGVRL